MVVFNEHSTPTSDRIFKLGHEVLSESDSYTHLGIYCNRHLTAGDSMKAACCKLRGTYLNICNSGLHPKALSPLTLRTIYETMVIPKALYGCETWTMYSKQDILRLERAHRFCIKHIQRLPRNASTNLSLCTLNMCSIETIIDYRKLQLCGQLCRLPCHYLAKTHV